MSDAEVEPVRAVGTELLTDISSTDASLELNVAESVLFGRLWAPDSLAEFTALVQWEFLGPGGLAGWRGQSNARWPLHSGAHRRLMSQPRAWLLDNAAVTENVMREYESRLLDVARLAGHGHSGRGLADLELLAKLQHHGAATRLVDFSRNAYVALWFACRAHPDDWGIVFGVNLDDTVRVTDEHTLNKDIEDLLAGASGAMMSWRPSALSPRIPAQAGFFLWSEARDSEWSSLGASADGQLRGDHVSRLDDHFAAIAVSPALKEYMASRWQNVLGLSEQSLFPDFDGFAMANGATQALNYTFWAE